MNACFLAGSCKASSAAAESTDEQLHPSKRVRTTTAAASDTAPATPLTGLGDIMGSSQMPQASTTTAFCDTSAPLLVDPCAPCDTSAPSTSNADYADLSRGCERPLPLFAIHDTPPPAFTYVSRNLNRTTMTVEGCMLPSLVGRGLRDGLLPRAELAAHLCRFHGEDEYLFCVRQRKAAGEWTATDASQAHGCGKCRWAPKGCGRCRAEGFQLGPMEGRSGGIPLPASEVENVVSGAEGDGGGVLASVGVSDDTHICRALRRAERHAGWGLVALEEIKAGTLVIEYVGEVLTRTQESRLEGAWLRNQSHGGGGALLVQADAAAAALMRRPCGEYATFWRALPS
mmetsp:Transcript_49222/g.113761  ORF Transcript_49222/g.113761 Transcript_49222/m.113761 type:complete len:343 (+) Transcript_49222:22-1050(+)